MERSRRRRLGLVACYKKAAASCTGELARSLPSPVTAPLVHHSLHSLAGRLRRSRRSWPCCIALACHISCLVATAASFLLLLEVSWLQSTFKMGMGRPGSGLGPGQMASRPVCEAMGQPNSSKGSSLTDPLGMMDRPKTINMRFCIK